MDVEIYSLFRSSTYEAVEVEYSLGIYNLPIVKTKINPILGFYTCL